MWIRRWVTWVFCWSWPWCGRVWEQGLDSQAKSWGLTFPRAVSLCSSPSRSPGAPVSPPVFLRLAPAVVPGTSHSRREGPARSWDHVQGRAGGGDPGGAPRQHPQPPISSSVSDEVILSFVDSLTEVTFHLPFSLSLCLAFGQTPSNHTTHSNPYVCGMCGLAGPVPQSQEGSASSSPRAPHACQLV